MSICDRFMLFVMMLFMFYFSIESDIAPTTNNRFTI
jgi:hypothetical protein